MTCEVSLDITFKNHELVLILNNFKNLENRYHIDEIRKEKEGKKTVNCFSIVKKYAKKHDLSPCCLLCKYKDKYANLRINQEKIILAYIYANKWFPIKRAKDAFSSHLLLSEHEKGKYPIVPFYWMFYNNYHNKSSIDSLVDSIHKSVKAYNIHPIYNDGNDDSLIKAIKENILFIVDLSKDVSLEEFQAALEDLKEPYVDFFSKHNTKKISEHVIQDKKYNEDAFKKHTDSNEITKIFNKNFGLESNLQPSENLLKAFSKVSDTSTKEKKSDKKEKLKVLSPDLLKDLMDWINNRYPIYPALKGPVLEGWVSPDDSPYKLVDTSTITDYLDYNISITDNIAEVDSPMLITDFSLSLWRCSSICIEYVNYRKRSGLLIYCEVDKTKDNRGSIRKSFYFIYRYAFDILDLYVKKKGHTLYSMDISTVVHILQKKGCNINCKMWSLYCRTSY